MLCKLNLQSNGRQGASRLMPVMLVPREDFSSRSKLSEGFGHRVTLCTSILVTLASCLMATIHRPVG